jgi:exo-beta-1,3-glucanase (GH17 family)
MQKSFEQTVQTAEDDNSSEEVIPTETEEDVKIVNGVYIYPDYE